MFEVFPPRNICLLLMVDVAGVACRLLLKGLKSIIVIFLGGIKNKKYN